MTASRKKEITDGDMSPCREVFVGGGWAGVYSMYRRIMDDPSRAPSVCLMEASWRIGGRTYSVPINHTTPFVQDVGAYRFSPDMHLVGDLILDQLQLPTECYQAGCPSAKEDFPKPFMFNYSAPLRRIVDSETRLPSGYVTALHTMIQESQNLGAHIYTNTKFVQFNLTDVDDKESFLELTFENMLTGKHYTVPSKNSTDPLDAVVLNLPRNKLFDVEGVKESLTPHVSKTIECIVFDAPAELFGEEIEDEVESAQRFTTNLGKAYLYYEDAFWRTKLHQKDGKWPPDVGFAAVPTPQGVRLNIRWYDGPVLCDKENATCNGLLEIYYSVSNETFYSSLLTSPDEPLGSVWETDGPESVEILQNAHEALVESLQPLLEDDGVDASSLSPPSGLIVGIWHRPNDEYPLGQGYTAPTKVLYYPTMSGTPDKACGVAGLSDEIYRDTVLQPWRQFNSSSSGSIEDTSIRDRIFLVNNDFGCMDVRYYWGDWAEESLLQAERAMHILGMAPPAWTQNQTYYQDNIVLKVYIPFSSNFTGKELWKWIVLPFLAIATIWAIFNFAKTHLSGNNKRQGQYTSIP